MSNPTEGDFRTTDDMIVMRENRNGKMILRYFTTIERFNEAKENLEREYGSVCERMSHDLFHN